MKYARVVGLLLGVLLSTSAFAEDYIGSVISPGVVAATGSPVLYSLAQLWNPCGSGVNALVSKVVVAVVVLPGTPGIAPEGTVDHPGTPPGTVAADFPLQTSPLSTLLTGSVRDKNLGIVTLPQSQMYYGTLPAGPGGGVTGVPPLHEFWLPKTEEDHTYSFDPPIIVPPCMGVAVRAAQPDMTAIGSFQWSEVAIP